MKPDQPLTRASKEQLLERVNARPGGPGGLVSADGARAMNDRLRVERYRLANGLRVLVMEDDSAATFAFQIWYGVGSKHEQVGKTGLAHFFEHLLFRESEGLAEGEFDRIIEMNGGSNNASTWVDWTFYRESLPTGAPSAVRHTEDPGCKFGAGQFCLSQRHDPGLLFGPGVVSGVSWRIIGPIRLHAEAGLTWYVLSAGDNALNAPFRLGTGLAYAF